MRRSDNRSLGSLRNSASTVVVAVIWSFVSGCGPAKPGSPTVQPSQAQTAPSIPVKFTDITVQAGLDFIQFHGGCGQRYFVEQVAAGAAVFDANGDGNLDIYFPAPKPLGVCKPKFTTIPKHRLYLGDGKGNFKLSPNAFGGVETDYGIAAAVGDYDNDGHPDLYVACFGKNKLFHNRGDGTFEDATDKAGVAVGGFSTGAVWFDYDGDGRLDLYVLRYCEWDLQKDIPCPGPNGERDVCEPRIYTPSTNVLFHNNGNGTFSKVTDKIMEGTAPRRSLSAAAVDFDGDGKLDLFVANDLGPNYLFHNKDGKLRDVAAMMSVSFGLTGRPQANMGLAVGDYNESGRLSVLVTTFANEPYTLYSNEGNYFLDVSAPSGISQPTMTSLGFGTGFIDTRNNGSLDLFFANGHISPFAQIRDPKLSYKQHNQLLLNTGKGQYTESAESLPADDVRVHRGACFGDFNNDGKMDILVTASDDRPTLLRNDTAGGNWIILRLTNKYGCCTPIGTRCIATIGKRKLLRVVMGGGSYGGDSDFRVHFGLDKAEKIDRLEIQWLSGKTQVMESVKANQILAIREAK